MMLGPSREAVRSLLQDLGWHVPSGTEVKKALAAYKYEMLTGAWLVMLKAKNWRPDKPVKIGCCVLGHNGRGEFQLFFGWNNTPRPLSAEEKNHFKPCAEKYAILKCLKAGYVPLGAWIWTEHNQPDDVTGLHIDVFCPCSNCTGWMEAIHLPPWFRIGIARTRLATDPLSDKWWVEDQFILDELGLMHQRSLEKQQRGS